MAQMAGIAALDRQGAGTFSFYWKVSSESQFDWLEFYLDDVRQDRISGSVAWQLKSYNITGAGDRTGEIGLDRGHVARLLWLDGGLEDAVHLHTSFAV